MTRKRIPLHPGAFIKSVYIEKGGLKADAIADAVGVHKGTMSRLINGHSYMTPAMAAKALRRAGPISAELDEHAAGSLSR
jgi:plasmid maintenance system antidote protein VapI